jgi:YaiO family outer membrane protein
MTLCTLAVAALLLAGDVAPDEHAEAVRLARAGSHGEALRRFRDQAARNPRDLEARVWVAQLLAWTGEPREAERTFREVLADEPQAVDALVGLGMLLDRQGRTGEALELLQRGERLDPARADTLAALGRAHRQSGRTALALAYYRRAARLAPGDPDIRRGLAIAHARHDHRLETTFAHESFPAGVPTARAGAFELSLRAGDGVRVALQQQVQRKFGVTESRTGAGLEWRVARHTGLRGDVSVAPGAAVLPRATAGVELERNTRYGDVTGALRLARFETADVWLAAPGVALPIGERFVLTSRYFLTVTRFDRLGDRVVNHSAAAAFRARIGERVWAGGSYARGNESFETLSIERIGRFSADTFGGSVRLETDRASSVQLIAECQRAEARNVWRLTSGIVRRF